MHFEGKNNLWTERIFGERASLEQDRGQKDPGSPGRDFLRNSKRVEVKKCAKCLKDINSLSQNISLRDLKFISSNELLERKDETVFF